MEIREAKRTEPPSNQQQLRDFRNATQESVNLDAIDSGTADLNHLPAFIDSDDRDDCLGK